MLKPKKNEIRKPTKTISGVTPIAVMLPPRKCKHGTCLYCPSLNVPQSYTPKSPAVLRASQVNYDAYEQVKARIKAFEIMNHPTDKIELIIMGGTFLEYPKKFQYEFIKSCYDGLNERISSKDTQGGHTQRAREPLRGKNLRAGDSSKDDSTEPSVDLEKAKKFNESKCKISIHPSIMELKKELKLVQLKNEKTKHRCVALCIETRPDVCVKYIDRLLEFGCTRVELGVQIVDDKIYQKIKRGHTVDDVIEATRVLKNAGFKVGYHLMVDLPGSNIKNDLKKFKEIFTDSRFRPDGIKIYPCQVIQGSGLERLYWNKKYKPYPYDELLDLLIKLKSYVPKYCRIMRVMREIPPEYLVAGTKRIDLRKVVQEEMISNGKGCKCIRCREMGFALKRGKQIDTNSIKLCRIDYNASEGKEIFLSFEDIKNDILIGLLRLRIPDKYIFKEINKKTAIVREMHTYGNSIEIGEKNKDIGQHKGYGKLLLKEAEKIAKKEFDMDKITVISGIGVRDYFRSQGYRLDGTYMVKRF